MLVNRHATPLADCRSSCNTPLAIPASTTLPATSASSRVAGDDALSSSRRRATCRWDLETSNRCTSGRSRTAIARARADPGKWHGRHAQPVRLRQPSAVGHRSVFRPAPRLPGVDQHHRQGVFHQEIEPLPVVTGRLHHHRRVAPSGSRSTPATPTVAPHVVTLVVNVPARFPGTRTATFTSAVFWECPSQPLPWTIIAPSCQGRPRRRTGRKFRNLTLVLKGNNPRFPWASFRATLSLAHRHHRRSRRHRDRHAPASTSTTRRPRTTLPHAPRGTTVEGWVHTIVDDGLAEGTSVADLRTMSGAH